MTRLFDRRVSVQLDNTSYDSFRTTFDVTNTLGGDPNKATISIYNVDTTTEAMAQFQRRDLRVRLLAGYGDVPRLIFEGNPVKNGVTLEKIDADRILRIQARDGLRTYRRARVSESFAADTTWQQVLTVAQKALGLPLGHVELPEDAASARLVSGLVLNGPAADVMDRLADSVGADWSIQNGHLQVVPRGSTRNKGPLYSAKLGNLIGAIEPKDDKGIQIRVLLDSSLTPGDRFRVETPRQVFDGVYKARSVKHAGDSGFDNPFYTTITAQPSPGDQS